MLFFKNNLRRNKKALFKRKYLVIIKVINFIGGICIVQMVYKTKFYDFTRRYFSNIRFLLYYSSLLAYHIRGTYRNAYRSAR